MDGVLDFHFSRQVGEALGFISSGARGGIENKVGHSRLEGDSNLRIPCVSNGTVILIIVSRSGGIAPLLDNVFEQNLLRLGHLHHWGVLLSRNQSVHWTDHVWVAPIVSQGGTSIMQGVIVNLH